MRATTIIQIHSIILFLLNHLNSTATAYDPVDIIRLNCGTKGTTTSPDSRIWAGDVGQYAPSLGPNTSSTEVRATNQGQAEEVPYITARSSHYQFTYSFPVTAGQKFIRLFFYASLYPEFNSSNTFFSIKSGRFTLLSNFSAYLTAEESGTENFFREFCINIDENQRLNLIFTPSQRDAYAFINGIEIVSMPTNLYYMPANGEGAPLVGQSTMFNLNNDTALEMVYRLNVGGQSVSPNQDTGMFRSWQDDTYYVETQGYVPSNTSIALKYSMEPNYTAPGMVYKTSRTMGANRTKNYMFNLTWRLPVDQGFMYLVRLHFCEFQPEIVSGGKREFHIFIEYRTVEEYADVITWSKGLGVPVKKDYVVMMQGDVSEGKKDLFIALHPNEKSRTEYSDVILNGIEAFKLSDGDGSLAGPNPEVPKGETTDSTKRKSKGGPAVIFISVGVGVAVLVASLSMIGCFMLRRWRRWLWRRESASKPPEDLCRQFTYLELQKATRNFQTEIGKGGFGSVYKGLIDGGRTAVAIKRRKVQSKQGINEFRTEISLLSRLRHRHLVSLIGYYYNSPEMMLVYDYMKNGTLSDHLHKANKKPASWTQRLMFWTKKKPLSWKQRLDICIGAAQGLNYLHVGAERTIINRDVKSDNILLDENWVGKVSDFGLSKEEYDGMNTAFTGVKGTYGYMDPDYVRKNQPTVKSDVYSFGVVLLEVLTGKPAVITLQDGERRSLAAWALDNISNGSVDKIIDKCLIDEISPKCLRKFVDTARRCLQENGDNRPEMSEVVGSLQLALTHQANKDVDSAMGHNSFNEEMFGGDNIVSLVDDRPGPLFDSNNSGNNWSTGNTSLISKTSIETDTTCSGS